VWQHGCNSTSKLQTPKHVYVVDPAVPWNCKNNFPDRAEVVENLEDVVAHHRIQQNCLFQSEVSSIQRTADHLKLSITGVNGCHTLEVSGVIVATGKHSDPYVPAHLPNTVHHASKLDGINLHGQRVLVIGGGSYAIEAVVKAFKAGATSVTMIARQSHWIVPTWAIGALNKLVGRNLQTHKKHNCIAAMLRVLLAREYYRHGLEHFVPDGGSNQFDTKISMNDEFYALGQSDKVKFVIGTVAHIGSGEVSLFDGQLFAADVVVAATGYQPPQFDFLKKLEPRLKASRIFKGYVLDNEPRVTFAGFMDMLVSHTNTLPLNIFLCLSSILDPKMRPPAERMSAWFDVMPPEVLSSATAHVAWLLEERSFLSRQNRSDSKIWIHRFLSLEAPRMRCFIFPHGAAGPHVCSKFASKAHKDIDVIAMQLPGREARSNETSMQCVKSLALKMIDAGVWDVDTVVPFVFVGFSFGAILAYEVAKQLSEQGKRLPVQIVVCASPPPGHASNLPHVDEAMPDIDFLTQTNAFTGTSVIGDALQNNSVVQEIARALRSDIAACVQYHRAFSFSNESRLSVPIFAVAGLQDDPFILNSLHLWSKFSEECSVYMGNYAHLFIDNDLFLELFWQRMATV